MIDQEKMEAFGWLLRRRRMAFGKEVRISAQELGVDTKTLQGWEEGNSVPKNDRLTIIAKVYKIGMSRLERVWKKSTAARKYSYDMRRDPKSNRPNYDENFGRAMARQRGVKHYIRM